MKEQQVMQEVRCQWCGHPLDYAGRGRKPKYCSQSCRQRAYEQRHGHGGIGISESDLVLRGEKAQYLFDSLFELRCAAEDINTAVHEGAGNADLLVMTEELAALAREIESIRLSVEKSSE